MIDSLLAQAPIPGLDFALQGLYDDLSAASFTTYEVLRPIALILAFLSLLLKAYEAGLGNLSNLWKQILFIGLLAVLLPRFPEIVIFFQSLFGPQLLEALEMDPIGIVETFFTDLAENTVQQFADPFTSVDGFLGAINPMEIFSRIIETIGDFLMIVIAIIAYFLILFVYIIQVFVIYMGIAAAPIFLGMLMWDTTRQTGIKYITGLFGICFWPLGWGLGLIFLDAMMTSDIIASVFISIAIAFTWLAPIVPIFQSLIALVWIFVTVFYAPKVVSKAITSGVQIGTGLVGEAIGMGSATAGAAVAATATVAGAAAGGPAGAAIGAAAGGAAGGGVKAAGNSLKPE